MKQVYLVHESGKKYGPFEWHEDEVWLSLSAHKKVAANFLGFTVEEVLFDEPGSAEKAREALEEFRKATE